MDIYGNIDRDSRELRPIRDEFQSFLSEKRVAETLELGFNIHVPK